MLKLFFWLLLIGNAVLFVVQGSYLGATSTERHEPQRLTQQLQPQTLTILPPNSPKLVPPATAQSVQTGNDATSSAAGQADVKPQTVACTEIGNFNNVEARKFGAQLAELKLNVTPTTINVQEVASHMVFIASPDGKEGAERKAAELRRLGIQDFYVIPDSQPNPSLRWAISLGVFKTEDAAKAYIAQLIPRGVRSARIMERNLSTSKLAYQWRNIDPGVKAALDVLVAKFPTQELRSCAG